MIIRPAVENDKQSIINLMQESDNRTYDWAENRTLKYVNCKNKLILVAEENSSLLRYIGIRNDLLDEEAKEFVDLEDYLAITWIAVQPSARGRGIGSDLLLASEKYAKIWKKKGLWLDCREKLIIFYAKKGYKIVGSFEKKGNSQYVMVKNTQPKNFEETAEQHREFFNKLCEKAK